MPFLQRLGVWELPSKELGLPPWLLHPGYVNHVPGYITRM